MMAQDVIPLGLGWEDEQPILGGYPKAPTQIPSVSHDGRIIYFNSPHPDFTFLLIDENSEIVYEISDFLYHAMVLMVEKGVTWEDVTNELAKR